MIDILRVIVTVILLMALPGCSLFIADCSKLVDDLAAYRKCTASQGDSQAQYELGLQAFEAKDYKMALKWLKLAATPNSGRSAVYMPPVGGATYGTVMMMDTGQATTGHKGAQALLKEMKAKGLGGNITVR